MHDACFCRAEIDRWWDLACSQERDQKSELSRELFTPSTSEEWSRSDGFLCSKSAILFGRWGKSQRHTTHQHVTSTHRRDEETGFPIASGTAKRFGICIWIRRADLTTVCNIWKMTVLAAHGQGQLDMVGMQCAALNFFLAIDLLFFFFKSRGSARVFRTMSCRR